MPSLAQMFSLVNQKSQFSRSDAEIYAALGKGGFRVYSAVLKEFRGTFLKVDESNITLVAGQTEYPLEADLSSLVHLAERQSAAENWHPILPEGLSDALTNTQQSLSWFDYGFQYGDSSQFRFYGPYLDSTAATGTQTQKIRISPAPTESRFVQVAYTAKWVPITSSASKVMLPDEGTYAMQDFATAEALRANDDTLSREYEAQGEELLTTFLNWMRVNQVMKFPSITPYLG